MIAVQHNGGSQLIEQPNFVRSINVTAADFDGTDTVNVATANKTKEANGSAFNPWKKNGGFIFKPLTTGVVDVIMWGDYVRAGKSIDNTLKQSVSGIAGEWNKERVVKIFTTSAVKTMNIGTII